MAYVMALQQGWPTDKLEFKGMYFTRNWGCTYAYIASVNNDIRGLIDSVNDGTTSAFMWEWFTTKPYADAGDCRFVSSRISFLLSAWDS